MNMGNHFSIFHSHPALEKGVKHQSPNYWVGYGHFPHSVQDEHVNLSIYHIPEKKAIMEMDLLDYTHAYFPFERFDTAFMDNNYVFGKKGEAYCAFIGTNELSLREGSKDNILQNGKRVYWITEAGSKQRDGDFGHFVKRIRENRVEFSEESLELRYQSGGREYYLQFNGDFKIDSRPINTDYGRYDSPYIRAEKKDPVLSFSHNGKNLLLDFEHLIRQF
jgi:hypothetical protein